MKDSPIDYTGVILAIVLLSALFAAGLWDLVALFTARDGANTVSYYLSKWSRQFPIGTFAFGIIIGHLLWQIPGVPTKVEIKP
jgi:hypothetical protein